MPTYIYQARARDGQKISGQMEGQNIRAIASQLRSTGIIPIDISEKKSSQASKIANFQVSFGRPSSLNTQELIFFSRQLYTLLKASVPVMQALDGLKETTENPALKKIIANLRDSLDEGTDLTTALRRQSDVFPSLFVSLVHIGETTGRLAEVFDDLSTYLMKEKETRDQVKAALRYPMIVLTVVAIGMVIINVFVLPNFVKMFSSFGAELPLPTRILMSTSDFMISYWYLCIVIPFLMIYAFLKYINTSHGKMLWDHYMLHMPLFGPLIRQSAIMRFARSLSVTGKSGVPMEQALRVIAPSVGNVYMEKKINEMRAGVERGESITENAKRTGIFPGIVLQLFSVGEESGSLDEMIGEVADYYEREIAHSIKALTSAIEPIMAIFIAGIVLVMALGIFLPMISLLGAIN